MVNNIIYVCNLCQQEFPSTSKQQIRKHEEWHNKPLSKNSENRIVGNVVWIKKTE